MGALFKFTAVVLLAVTAKFALRLTEHWGGFTHHYMHRPGPCKEVKGIQPGSEDFQVLSSGQMFISSGLRNPKMSPKCHEYWQRHNVKGRVYLMDLRHAEEGVTELKISSTSLFNVDTFVPHGLSVWEDKKTGRHIVFVVNHPFEDGAAERIEKFLYDPTKQELVHHTYFSDKAMTFMNDVVATGENSFYFTNSHYFRNTLAVLAEILLELPLNNVVYYDGDSFTVADSGLRFLNGIAMSSDTQYIYVACMVSREILVYKRNKNNTLSRVQEYPLYSWPDNIQVDLTTGDLYVGLHPIPHQLMTYSDDIGGLHSPSQVLQLQTENGVIVSSKELFYDHGELISGCSSALVHNGTLLIGSINDRFVSCQVNVPL